MYITIVKDETTGIVYRMSSKTFVAVERRLAAIGNPRNFNGVLAVGDSIDKPELWYREIKKGKVKKLDLVTLAACSQVLQELVESARQFGAYDLGVE